MNHYRYSISYNFTSYIIQKNFAELCRFFCSYHQIGSHTIITRKEAFVLTSGTILLKHPATVNCDY